MGPLRTPSEDSVWLKFPPAPQHKVLPQVKLSSQPQTWPISQSLPTLALDMLGNHCPKEELWWVVGAIPVSYWGREARPVSIDFVALPYTTKTVTHYGHILDFGTHCVTLCGWHAVQIYGCWSVEKHVSVWKVWLYHAALRSLWGNTRGSSSLLGRTITLS